jgi:uncharacterized coiled-coil protein SlyX
MNKLNNVLEKIIKLDRHVENCELFFDHKNGRFVFKELTKIEKFKYAVLAGEFSEAMAIFHDHGDESYVRTLLEVMGLNNRTIEDLNRCLYRMEKRAERLADKVDNLRVRLKEYEKSGKRDDFITDDDHSG